MYTAEWVGADGAAVGSTSLDPVEPGQASLDRAALEQVTLTTPSVLLMTNDAALAREVRRVAAGIAVPVAVHADPLTAMVPWQEATLVIVGGDCAVAASRLHPSRRSGVLVLSPGDATPEVFRSAFDLGAARVVELPTSHDWLVDALAESGSPQAKRGKTVGFISAAGGSGGSSLAVATACVGARSLATVLVDLDPVGIGVERLIGHDGASVTTWGTLGVGGLAPQAFRDALPSHHGVRLVGFGSSPPQEVARSASATVLSACPQVFDLTVVNLPRPPGAAAREAVERCDLVVVTAPQSVAAALSGHRLVASLPASAHVVLVTRSGPRVLEPAAVAEALELPLLESVSDQRGLDEVLAGGMAPLTSRGPGLRQAARAVLNHPRLA